MLNDEVLPKAAGNLEAPATVGLSTDKGPIQLVLFQCLLHSIIVSFRSISTRQSRCRSAVAAAMVSVQVWPAFKQLIAVWTIKMNEVLAEQMIVELSAASEALGADPAKK